MDDPLWYKDAIIYELHVKSFFDGYGDGIGDFRGLLKKLDYIKNLGVTAIWLLPFYPSPLRDDGYDIADHFNIHADYGTLSDFKEFLREAHRLDVRVITELVLNHTSDSHPWFQKARRAGPGTMHRDFYTWSDTPDRYRDARIIFKDFETSNWEWDRVAQAYYWHRFYSHQPDLNYDNPQVHKAIFRVIDFWLGMGVDGLRLDAVPYLYEREGTNCENLPETHVFLKKLRSYIDGRYRNRMLLAEANQWPEDAVAYFGNGDECHMAFHFPLMPRMFMALEMEDRFPIIDILEQTPAIPEGCQWALFLRNHDELTLEMVTDEERDYMYRAYARDRRSQINLGIRRRLAPLLSNSRRKIELMNVLLFSLPGTPIIYYGDEIGMGDNYYLGDRNGVRTPMQWSPDMNAGFSMGNPQKLYLPVIIDPEYHYAAVNVENQEKNLSSLLWWTRRMIVLRKQFKAFSRGTLEFLNAENPKVIAFIRRIEDEIVLVVINLSRFSQVAEIDLSRYEGFVPEDMFSLNRFPPIRKTPYVIILGPHNYHWLVLKKKTAGVCIAEERTLPEINVRTGWKEVLKGKQGDALRHKILPGYLSGCCWFAHSSRRIRKIDIVDAINISRNHWDGLVLLLELSYSDGPPVLCLLPLAYASGDKAKILLKEFSQGVLARLRIKEERGVLYDGTYDEAFRTDLFEMIERKMKLRGARGELITFRGRMLKGLQGDKDSHYSSQVLKEEPGKTSILYEGGFVLKLYRHPEESINPELEIGKFLFKTNHFAFTPPFAGAIEYKRSGQEHCTIAVLQGFVPAESDALAFVQDWVVRYYERVLSMRPGIAELSPLPEILSVRGTCAIPPIFRELAGEFFLEAVSLIGKRIGELHLALSSDIRDPDFAPEPFSMLYQQSVYQSMRSLAKRVLQDLGKNLERLPEEVRRRAKALLSWEEEILAFMREFSKKRFSAMKIRLHGDCHLANLLYNGKDFILTNFEGPPGCALSEARLKRSCMRDMAAMIRSFHYAAWSVLLRWPHIKKEDIPLLERWAKVWYKYTGRIFLDSYLVTVGDAAFIPKERGELETMLNAFMLDRCVREIGYELNNRPGWLIIPIEGIRDILGK